MTNPLVVLINPGNQRLFGAASAVTAFLVILALFASFFFSQAYLTLDSERQVALGKLTERAEAAFTGFALLNQLSERNTCSEPVVHLLREAAFAPDGINEFLLVNGDRILCASSLGALPDPVLLPESQFTTDDGARFWFDADLTPFGHKGEKGTILAAGEFGAILPANAPGVTGPDWLSLEGVVWAPGGIIHHVSGKSRIFEQNLSDQAGFLAKIATPMSGNACDEATRYCVGARLDTTQLFLENIAWVLISVSFAALSAHFIYGRTLLFVQRYLSFEARFRRNFVMERIVCTYQPIYDVDAREICGAEVLARWRDIDDSIVYPDRFLPILETDGRMADFNRMIVTKAFIELERAGPAPRQLEISFNISPSSIGDPDLPNLFDAFLARHERYSVVVEIVENEKVNFEDAEKLIQALRRRGIKTYIDDFGAGYSNMENLARLSVDAVKLDKSFALAPPHSLMAEMLDLAIRMVHGLGKAVVVEGVETAERMDHLVGGAWPVHYLQGYLIARPLEIRAFMAFLEQRNIEDKAEPNLQMSA